MMCVQVREMVPRSVVLGSNPLNHPCNRQNQSLHQQLHGAAVRVVAFPVASRDA